MTDNASIHHVDRNVTTIQNTGALVRYLLPYSPDFSPIEELFAKVKTFLIAKELPYDVTTSPSLLITMGFCTVPLKISLAIFHMLVTVFKYTRTNMEYT